MRVAIALSAFSALALAGVIYTHPAAAAPVDAVIGACDRTAGCNYKIEGNGISGCSPNACFRCPADGSRQCTQVPQQSRTQPGGTPGAGPAVGGASQRMLGASQPGYSQRMPGGSNQPMQALRPNSLNRLR